MPRWGGGSVWSLASLKRCALWTGKGSKPAVPGVATGLGNLLLSRARCLDVAGPYRLVSKIVMQEPGIDPPAPFLLYTNPFVWGGWPFVVWGWHVTHYIFILYSLYIVYVPPQCYLMLFSH